LFEEFGFPYPENLIMSYIGGSQAHGAKVNGTDDTDWFGVFVEPPEKILGIDHYQHFVTTTGGKPGGNGPQDVDVCLYSLNKWAHLAAKGNPSCLHFLFAPLVFNHFIWARLSLRSSDFLSKNHVMPFLGFANDQLRRLFGEKGQKNIHRAELEDQYGYDTKYAMHVVRLYGEAKELMETGKITLPRPNKDELIAIRQGKYKLHEIHEISTQLEAEALAAREQSPLPERIDRDKISKIVSEAYRDFWKSKGTQ
jgi:uncharacterized protein